MRFSLLIVMLLPSYVCDACIRVNAIVPTKKMMHATFCHIINENKPVPDALQDAQRELEEMLKK
jgi:hypothetical protein